MLKECGFGVAANCSRMQRGETTRYSTSCSSAAVGPMREDARPPPPPPPPPPLLLAFEGSCSSSISFARRLPAVREQALQRRDLPGVCRWSRADLPSYEWIGGVAQQPAPSSYGGVSAGLRKPDLRRATARVPPGQVIGRYAFFVAVSVYAFDYGGLTAVAIVTVARQAAAAVVAPLASPFADRLPRARVMLASDLGRCFCAVGMAVAAARGGNPLLVYALAVTSSAFTAVFRPAEAALIAEVAESPDQLTASNAVASMFDSVGIFIGPALGAVVLSDLGYDFAFALIAGAFAWSSMMIARIATRGLAGRPRRREDHPEDSFGGTLLTGLRRLAYEPDLRLVIGLYDAQFFVAGALGVLQVSVAFELLDVGSLGFGFLDVCAGAGAIVGATFAMNSPRVSRPVFCYGLVLWGTPLCLISAVPATWVALLAFALLGAGNSLVDVSAVSLLQRLTPSEMTATVFGVLESSLVVAVALGALAAAPLVDLFGVRGALFVTGGLLPALALLGRRRVSRVHDSDEAVVGRIAVRLQRRPLPRAASRANPRVPRSAAVQGRAQRGHRTLRAWQHRRRLLHPRGGRTHGRASARHKGTNGTRFRGRDRLAPGCPENRHRHREITRRALEP